ncbi:MAG: Tox-REase-5 domain-containing protein, partial [Thermaerobacter sp.]|nr:Tox-REase-5 domain-containing protein [Thermaerobacter sp.]
AGRRTSRTGLAGTSTYTYDAAGRLTGATYPAASGLTDATYTYDPVGNRTSADGVPYAYDAADRLTSDGTYIYAYDDSGNVTSRTDIATGAVISFEWNANHQLLAVHYPDGTTTTYAYDALGRRIGVDAAGRATGYVYDGANIHLEYDGGSLAAVYTTGLRADSALEMTRGGQSYYYLQDGLGSTTALTDAAGAVVDAYRYDAFGNPVSTGTVENPFTFTGREYDSTDGIYYYRTRYYDPGVGRFLSEDPLPSYNPYPYAADDPVDYVDPSGAQTTDEYATLVEQEPQGGWAEANESMSAASRAYQEYITGTSKVWLQNGTKFDGMQDGTLVEAKDNYANFVNKEGEFYDWFKGAEALVEQAKRQVAASNGLPIRWYFSNQASLNATRALLDDAAKGKLPEILRIQLIYEPMQGG